MQKVKSLGIASCAKMFGLIYAIMGLLFIPFALLGAAAAAASPQKDAGVGAGVFLILGLGAPFFYGFFGAVMGALSALLYNILAKWIGGIEVELEGVLSDMGNAAAAMPGTPQ